MASVQSYLIKLLIQMTVNWNQPLEKVRVFLEKPSLKEKIPENIRVERIILNGVLSEWFIPNEVTPDRAVIYLHGGGFCLGVVNTNRNFVAELAETYNLPIILLHYRLAPENPFPSAIHDSLNLYNWLLNTMKLPSNRIAYLADSSGCGLALSTIIELRKKGTSLPACLAFMTPVVDLSHSGSSFVTQCKNDPFKIREEFQIDKHYVGNNDASDPNFSPLFADLSQCPDTIIHGAEYDIFQSDSERLFVALMSSGCKSELKMWQKLWHLFQFSSSILPEGKKSLDEIFNFLKSKSETTYCH